jgi:hypothetical protein
LLLLEPSTYSLMNSSVGAAEAVGAAATKGTIPTARAAAVAPATRRRTGRDTSM